MPRPAEFPPFATCETIVHYLTGPTRTTTALRLQEWIRALLTAGFAPAAHAPTPAAFGQLAVELTDPDGRVTARAEYGWHWPVRTALRPATATIDGWWVSTTGLIPTAAILAATSAAECDGPAADEHLINAGWRHCAYHTGSRGRTPVAAWSDPRGTRTVACMHDGPDEGWRLHFDDPPGDHHLTLDAAPTTPPDIIAALATHT